MTSDLPDSLMDATTPAMLAPAKPRKCVRHRWGSAYGEVTLPVVDGIATLPNGATVRASGHWLIVPVERPGVFACSRCGAVRDETRARRGRNNRKRGNGAELTVARGLNARKMGPLGLPWDVEMPGYARLQVKKLASPPSLRAIVGMLAAIGTGAEMPGVIWIEPGRGGERLIVFRLADFAERHGVPTGGDG